VDEQRWSLDGEVCAITGANSGIGREVALGFARLGGTVVLLVRRVAEGECVRRWILAQQPDADVSLVACDLADFQSIRRAAHDMAERWPQLGVLVHNAAATFPQRTLTANGIEATLAVDAVGPFLLTALLRQRLEAGRARVIMLTGIAQRRGRVDTHDLHFTTRPYHWPDANNQAQHARWLFMSELARRAPRLTAVAVHPGAVLTGAQARLPLPLRALIRTIARPAFVRAEVGAIPVLRLAAQPYLPEATGRFVVRCRLEPDVADPRLAVRFWSACEAMTDGWRDVAQPSTRPTHGNAVSPASRVLQMA
jgi:NAD(P)-dependent dehydrogenase (short-subunit alcohol dehydrogenase family)